MRDGLLATGAGRRRLRQVEEVLAAQHRIKPVLRGGLDHVLVQLPRVRKEVERARAISHAFVRRLHTVQGGTGADVPGVRLVVVGLVQGRVLVFAGTPPATRGGAARHRTVAMRGLQAASVPGIVRALRAVAHVCAHCAEALGRRSVRRPAVLEDEEIRTRVVVCTD